MKAVAALAAAAVLALGAIACSSDDDAIDDNGGIGSGDAPLARTPLGDDPRGGLNPSTDDEEEMTVLSVETTDIGLSVGQSTLRSGKIRLEIKNEGISPADFFVLKTDMRAAALPLDADGEIDTGADGIEVLETIDGIAPGDTETVTIELDSGHYVMLSDTEEPHVPGLGADITVSHSPA
jgi:hypothetical protein